MCEPTYVCVVVVQLHNTECIHSFIQFYDDTRTDVLFPQDKIVLGDYNPTDPY